MILRSLLLSSTLFASLIGAALLPQTASKPKPARSTSVDFRTQIDPFLKANCVRCHNETQKASGLALATPEGLFRGGGKAVAAVLPGRGKQSPLIQYLRGERKPQMPLGGQVSAAAITLIERWIDEGAKVDGKAFVLAPSITNEAADLPPNWPYGRPLPTEPPKIKNTAWIRNPIDNFVLAKLEAKGLHPAPEAGRLTLIRRVTYDLTGLPPTPQAIQEFLADQDPNAYEHLVDRLLASPAYGERWARHWLDLARYADSNGYEADQERGNAWRYRDYVIQSLNKDKPYDRFIKEQLAGDELYPNDPDALVATGFLRNGPWDTLAFDKKAQRNDFLTDVTDTTGAAFLGLTFGCARCHNHKYDPIPQADYYRLQAFFTQVKMEDRFLAGVPDFKGRPAQAMVVVDANAQAPKHYLLQRGDINSPGEEVEPAFPACLAGKETRPVITPTADGKSTGRRSALANWIASPDNPQTARVLVNRVWQFHFGRGLVSTPSDYGKNGDRPTHPALLDWLAATFVSRESRVESRENGAPSLSTLDSRLSTRSGLSWSLKKLHRLLLTSAAYRQSTQWDAACAKADPDNRLLWRMNRMRLEGEQIRDAMLAAAGDLNPAMGGPGVFPLVQKEVLDTGSTHKWGTSSPEDRLRRSIYVFQRRSLVLPLVDVFDGADLVNTCPRRAVTTIAPQALALLNGQFPREQARVFAARVVKEAGSDPAKQVEATYLHALGRTPTATEKQTCLQFLTKQSTLPARAPTAALTDLCHILFNTNEFVYVD